METTFRKTANLISQNSFGVIDEEDKVLLEFTIGFHNDTKQTGWFEWFDVKTGGGKWYCEGGLWFDGLELTGYDGCYSIAFEILDKLEEMGFDVSEYRSTEES